MSKLALTFDIGTQSMRVALTNKEGEFIDIERKIYDIPYISDDHGAIEQVPSFYYDTMCSISKTLLQRNKEFIKDIIGVSFCCFRDSAILLDENKKPVHNIILWLDQRRAKYDGSFGAWKYIFKLVGLYDTAIMQYEMTPANWMRQKYPDTWNKVRYYTMLPAYLNYLLTGNLVDSIANQTGHMPVDYHNRKWLTQSGINNHILQIPLEMMVPFVETGEQIGTINHKTFMLSGIPEGLPVIAGAPDKACETLGLSVIKPGSAAISLGTAATIDIAVQKYCGTAPFLPSYPACDTHTWNPELQIYRGFWMLSWIKNTFGKAEAEECEKLGITFETYMNEKLREVPVGSHGLIIQPYWQPGIEHPHARGAMIGFHDEMDLATIYRACIEGIGFTLRAGKDNLEKRSKSKVSQLYIGGGGSVSDDICQLMSDLFDLPVTRGNTNEASSLGIAMTVFCGMHEFDYYQTAIDHMFHQKDTFLPNKENASKYHEIYERAYKGMYKDMSRLNEVIYSYRNIL